MDFTVLKDASASVSQTSSTVMKHIHTCVLLLVNSSGAQADGFKKRLGKSPAGSAATSTLIQDGKADTGALRTEACFIKVGILTVKLNAMKRVFCA